MAGKIISTFGRIINVRNLGGIIFLKLLNGSNTIEFVIRKDYYRSEFDSIKKINKGDFAIIEYVKKDTDNFVINIPLLKKGNSSKFFITSETELYLHIIQNFVKKKILDFFEAKGFLYVDLPFIHPGEIKQEAFYVKNFFEKPARLTTSNALYLNIMAFNFIKVFTLTRCFRAEPSKTSRHLSEFNMLEVAMLNEDLLEVMDLLEELIVYILDSLEKSAYKEYINAKVMNWKNRKFLRLPYKTVNQKYKLNNKGLGKYEKRIAREGPTFVIGFPPKIASWMSRLENNEEAQNFNLLLPGVGEVAEGNSKITFLTLLKSKFQISGMYPNLKWYLKLSPYDNIMLSGFGLGMERLFMWIFDLKNIRKVFPFYRDWRFAEDYYE